MATKNIDESSSTSTSFEKRLTAVNTTQESVQTLSLWILYHHTQYEILLKVWFKVLKKSKPSHRLTLFYVANDVIQNAKKQNAAVYQQAFKPYLNSAMIYVKENSIRKKIQRILEIWRERAVYDDEFIDELLKKLLGTEVFEKDKEVTRVIAEFQPKSLCETLLRFKQVESETLLKEQLITNEMKLIDGMSVENVRKLKDKTSTDAYHVEYENSRDKFQEYVSHFERLVQERKALKQSCEQAEIFYDAQYQDANIVVEAYKSFGDKVATLKRKLDSLIRDLPETNSSPSVNNVISPGNTPPDYRQTDMDLSDSEDNATKSPSDRIAVVRSTRPDPRHTRKHLHHRSPTQFDDADERSRGESHRLISDKKTAVTSNPPMIDVNAITELLIQHSQSTGFEKSLEMLTQTLRQLTDNNATSSSVSSLPTPNPFDNLLMKHLPNNVVPPPTVSNSTPQLWFTPPGATTFPPTVPGYFTTTLTPPTNYPPPQQHYQNPRS